MQKISVKGIIPANASEQAVELFQRAEDHLHRRTDRLFSMLMVFQWLAGIAAALWISPRTWLGATSYIHWHVWAAIFFSGAIFSFPMVLAWKHPGDTLTRHTIAVSQMLFAGLLIHLTGGRIETHFQIFGSLAFLAFYRDWKVLVSATVVTALDHFLRGAFWPQSIYGVLSASPWRWFEHAGWVLYEDTFLIISIRQSLKNAFNLAERQAALETVNANIEQKIVERTAELTNEIEERKRTEEALRESEASYHSLVDQMPAGIFRKDREGRYLFVNSWFCRFRGTKPADYLGKMPDEVAKATNGTSEQHFDAASLFAAGTQHHLSILQNGQPIMVEEEYCLADGKTVHHHVIKSPVFGPDGTVVGSQGILLDVTQRKLAEAELAYERDLLRTLLENSTDHIYFKDDQSRFIKASNSQARQFGVASANGLVGKSDFDFFTEEHARPAFEDEQEIIRTGQPMVGKIELESWKDGRKESWVLTTKMPLRDKSGEIVGTFGISKDITAIKTTEEKLEQVHKQLVDASRQAGMAEVATSVLHNVGNVLNSVNVSSSLIADKVRNSKVVNLTKVAGLIQIRENDLAAFFTSDPKGKQIPNYLSNLAAHMVGEQEDILHEVGSLVNNIVHIREIVAMQQNYAKASGILESLKITDLVEDAIRMNNGAMERHQVKIVRDLAEVPPILTDKHKILQILVNLIRNAKYACDDLGREDKQITVRVANGDGRIKISVIDNGIGIPTENLTRIFNHGFTTKKEGHGFGLHSGALAAKGMGGALTVFSEGPGRGAAFTLELPLQQPRSNS